MLDDASSSTSLQPVSSSEEPPATTVSSLALGATTVSPTISPPSTSNKHPRRMALPCVLSYCFIVVN